MGNKVNQKKTRTRVPVHHAHTPPPPPPPTRSLPALRLLYTPRRHPWMPLLQTAAFPPQTQGRGEPVRTGRDFVALGDGVEVEGAHVWQRGSETGEQRPGHDLAVEPESQRQEKKQKRG